MILNKLTIKSYGHMLFPQVYEELIRILEEVLTPKPINDFD